MHYTHISSFFISVQLHHLLNNGAEINQRDEKGFTPLHRAAYLAQFDGYLEIYEYLLVRRWCLWRLDSGGGVFVFCFCLIGHVDGEVG